MSSVGLNNDRVTTDLNNKNAQHPGEYMLNKPLINSNTIYPYLPVLDENTGMIHESSQIDVGSELRGQTYGGIPFIHSKNPNIKYNPSMNNAFHNGELQDLLLNKEYSRLNNPPSNIRGLAPNRFEWLCSDPQENVSFNVGNGRRPYNWHIDTKSMAKDNHRPSLPTPLDQYLCFPRSNNKCMNGIPDLPQSAVQMGLSNHTVCGYDGMSFCNRQ